MVTLKIANIINVRSHFARKLFSYLCIKVIRDEHAGLLLSSSALERVSFARK